MSEPTWTLDQPGFEEFYGRAIQIWHNGGADREEPGGHLLGQIQVVVIDEFGSDEDAERAKAVDELAAKVAEFLNKEAT